MMAGLLPPPPPPPPPSSLPPSATATSQASAAAGVEGPSAVDEEARPPLPRAASAELTPRSLCEAVAGNAGGNVGSCCAAEASEDLAASAHDQKAAKPLVELGAAEQPPPPPTHPVFGSPKGKTFAGGGGGKLVEALRPLMSGNTRTWLVVSVGGGGKGGPPAAWRALDVARRVTGVSTTCIRLR